MEITALAAYLIAGAVEPYPFLSGIVSALMCVIIILYSVFRYLINETNEKIIREVFYDNS